MLNLYSTISLSIITNAFMVTLYSNIKTLGGTLLELKKSKLKKKKKKKKKKNREKKKRQTFSPAGDLNKVASVINQQYNHYTTATADSVSEIKYLYMHPCLLWETSVVKSSNCFQRWIARYCTQNAYFDIGSCRFGYFDRPKAYQIFQNMALFDLIIEADYPDDTAFFI